VAAAIGRRAVTYPRPRQRNRWLLRTPAAGTRARVFLIPYAGCGAGLYRRWPREWASVELVPVELPGRETRLAEPVMGTFQELAAAMNDALEPYFDVPFAFFGHCWSAMPAYEATAQLQRAGAPKPAALLVSSQVAPQDGPIGRMLSMTDAEMAAELQRTIRALGGQPHPDLVSIYVDVLRADVDTSRQYVVPDPVRLSCPITAIGWTGDTEISPGQMTGWPVCGETEVLVLEGHHHRFVDAPPEFLDALCAPLRRS